MHKLPLIFGSIYGMLAVVFGAFGAHLLAEKLSEKLLASWETGVRYQMFHALALLLLGLFVKQGMNLSGSIWCLIVGSFLFSGSIYLLSLGIGPSKLWGPITPLGGLTLILGWGWMLISFLKS